MDLSIVPDLPIAVLDAVPNPILVKDAETRYVWVNAAFERLFDVRREDLIGELDVDVFQNRQAAQCNGGDLRVLSSGEIDEAEETVADPELGPRQTITRKSRLTVGDTNYLVGVMHDITEVKEQNRQLVKAGEVLEDQARELQRLASIDSLTECLNRRAVMTQAAEIIDDDSIGVIAIDLDYFKEINDRYGHGGGDAVLAHFAATVRAQLRRSDLFGRVGGEEFIILLPGATAEVATAVAERICTTVRDSPAEHGSEQISHTVSVGVAHKLANSTVSVDELLKAADSRLYEAKTSGRDRVANG